MAFIVFEGIDGAGTTSQVGRLLQALKGLGRPAHRTAEPSAGPIGRLLRQLLSDPAAATPEVMALLFAADRRDHLRREVLPQLAAGSHVICDRYLLSSLVYQVAAGAPRALILAAHQGIRPPDLTLLLSVPPAVAAARRAGRGGAAEIYENDPMQAQVAAAYLAELAQPDAQALLGPVRVLDGSGTQEEVAAAVLDAVGACLGLPAQARSS